VNEQRAVAPGRGIAATLIVVSERPLGGAIGTCEHVDCGLGVAYRVVVVVSGVMLATWVCAGHYRSVFCGDDD
jgi:hypothetical protein